MERNQLIDFIAGEHFHLRKLFNRSYALAREKGLWKEFIDLCEELFEKNHHAKEEKYIFNTVKDIPQLRGGGPLCTYFFDFHMSQPALKQAVNVAAQVTGFAFEPQWNENMIAYRKENLPLVIPGEDHEAGRLLLRAGRFLLKYQPDRADLGEKMIRIFDTYMRIQELHFDREEKCFLVMCTQLVPPARWDQLIEEMNSHYREICSSE